MASDKSTDFLKRNRPPRVNISYEDPYDSEKMVELPFVLGVMVGGVAVGFAVQLRVFFCQVM